MTALKTIPWKQIFVALMALGVISGSDPNTVIISLFAMAIVAVCTLGAKYFDKPIERGWVSLIVYAVSFGLALAQQSYTLSLPVWSGDPVAFTDQLAALIGQIGPLALTITGAATIFYNALSKIVFEKLEERLPRG